MLPATDAAVAEVRMNGWLCDGYWLKSECTTVLYSTPYKPGTYSYSVESFICAVGTSANLYFVL